MSKVLDETKEKHGGMSEEDGEVLEADPEWIAVEDGDTNIDEDAAAPDSDSDEDEGSELEEDFDD